ncbi:MAG: DUF2142 domain-containing protein [Flavobacteriales bacterium]|nr:DUF2142 domain-containing protein [Flavobacteriales bacterium]
MNTFKRFLDYPYLFLIVGLWMGVRFAYINPPWQSNDEDRHFFNAYAMSTGQLGPTYEDGKAGLVLPPELFNTVMSFQGFPYREGRKLDRKYIKSVENRKIKPNSGQIMPRVSSTLLPVGYIPASIGIWLARKSGKSILEIGYWSRVFSLFGYLALVFIALQKIPAGFKPILFVSALLPMTLYQAASVSYDGLTNALLFLYLAFVLKYCLEDVSLNWKHVLLFVGLAFAQRFTKDGYFLLYFTALAIPMRRFKERSMFWAMIGGLLIASFLPGWLWSTYLNSKDIPKEAFGIFQRDFYFNQMENLKFHLQDPIGLVMLMFKNIAVQGKTWLIGMVGRFGYSYTLLPDIQVLGWYLLLLLVSAVERPRLIYKASGIIGGLTLANMGAVIGGFLLISAVGANYIFGFQGRYLSVFIPFILIAFLNPNLIKIDKSYLPGILGGICLIMLFIAGNFLDNYFYLP